MNYSVMGIEIYLLISYFIIFSFAGWLMETIRVSIKSKTFVNRGFLNGPFCPIYGVGMNLIILFLYDFRQKPILVGIMGMIFASVLEYFTSYVLEKLFNEKWWDYSYRKFNIKGRISADISVAWGILSLVMIEYVVPFLNNIIDKIDKIVLYSLMGVFFVYFSIDMVITIHHLVSFSAIRQKLRASRTELIHSMAYLKSYMSEKYESKELRAKFEERFDSFIQRYVDVEQIVDFKEDFKEFFNDFNERLFEEPFEKYHIQEKLDKYKRKMRLITAKRKKLVHRRILKAFPRLNKIESSYLNEIKKYFKDSTKKESNNK